MYMFHFVLTYVCLFQAMVVGGLTVARCCAAMHLLIGPANIILFMLVGAALFSRMSFANGLSGRYDVALART